jgi:hypothetical protein
VNYVVLVTSPQQNRTFIEVGGIQEARDVATDLVHERMEAFGDDREALRAYGFYDAEAKALDMTEEGGEIFLQDGWKIRIASEHDDLG